MIKYLFILIFFSACSSNDYVGKYESFWYETEYELILNSNETFKYSFQGHRGNAEFEGIYHIVNDTIILNDATNSLFDSKFLIYNDDCLVEMETRFSYCIQESDEWIMDQMSINYPQLQEKNLNEKDDVIKMLQVALTDPRLLKYFDKYHRPLIIQEYYEIKSENNVKFSYNGVDVIILSKEEIERKNIEKYLIIDEITIGLKTAFIDFQVMPEFSIGLFSVFIKEKGRWNIRKRYEII